jgi:calcineurin-like phosphoesterase family protein
MTYWFTADWHLWHKNVLKHGRGEFNDIDGHNLAILTHINARLTPQDHLVILGDLCMGGDSRAAVDRLSGFLDILRTKNLHLVYGNHDHTVKKLVKLQPHRFQRTGDILEFKLPAANTGLDRDVKVVACHYAMRVWKGSHYGTYHVYGHSHGNLADDPNARSMDVGVDTNQMRPWSLRQIVDILDKKKFKPVDHHVEPSGS